MKSATASALFAMVDYQTKNTKKPDTDFNQRHNFLVKV